MVVVVVVVVVVVGGGVLRLSFERLRGDGAMKIEQVRTRKTGSPNVGHFVIT